MHLANLTTDGLKRISGLLFAILLYTNASAQENSPYSRFGIGDLTPNQNIVNRTMGGISAGYASFSSLNFLNPASLGAIFNTIFDLGGEVDFRSLRNTQIPGKSTSTNAVFSYLQVGFPISTAKMKRKNIFWGLSFGLRPISKINYKIEKNERLSGIDSLNTLFEGSGGLNQANISTGVRIKNFSLGISTGYNFGNKDYSTRLNFLNDSVIYYKSNSETKASYGGVFLNVGVQYMFETGNKGKLIVGAYTNLQQSLKAKQNHIDETFTYDGNGAVLNIDTVAFQNDEKGTVKLPSTYGIGFTYQDKNNHWLVGADMEFSNWSKYRYYDKEDAVQNSWTIKAGAEYLPASATTASSKYWSFVRYRAGIYYGPDYIKLDKSRSNYGATLGASLPLTSFRQRNIAGEFVLLNTGIEVGGRGSKQNSMVRETILRFNVGISMNGAWFFKRKYD